MGVDHDIHLYTHTRTHAHTHIYIYIVYGIWIFMYITYHVRSRDSCTSLLSMFCKMLSVEPRFAILVWWFLFLLFITINYLSLLNQSDQLSTIYHNQSLFPFSFFKNAHLPVFFPKRCRTNSGTPEIGVLFGSLVARWGAAMMWMYPGKTPGKTHV